MTSLTGTFTFEDGKPTDKAALTFVVPAAEPGQLPLDQVQIVLKSQAGRP